MSVRTIMGRGLASAVSLVFAALASQALAIPPPPIPAAPAGAATYTDQDLASTPTAELIRRLFSDYALRFTEKRRNRAVEFYTRPKTAFVGVCEVTRLSFPIAKPMLRTEPVAKGYVEGMSVDRLYRYVDPPGGPYEPQKIDGYRATEPLCDALPDGSAYFPAPSAPAAGWQRRLIDQAIERAGSGEALGFGLQCVAGAGKSCDARKVLQSLHASDIAGIVARDCAGDTRDDCYEVTLDGWVLETEVRLATYGYTLTDPDQLLVSIGVSKLPHYLAVVCAELCAP